jgi:hypothetical protein
MGLTEQTPSDVDNRSVDHYPDEPQAAGTCFASAGPRLRSAAGNDTNTTESNMQVYRYRIFVITLCPNRFERVRSRFNWHFSR